MCTRTRNAWCSQLSPDRTGWSTTAPMGPPAWVRAAITPLSAAIELADQGDVDRATDRFRSEVPDGELNEWFDLHAQYVYKWRCNAQGIPNPVKLPEEQLAPKLGSPKSSLPQEVFDRDSYRCRYCELPLISLQAFARFSSLVGTEVFPITGKRNKDKAGASMVFRATADHVDPWSRGGATELGNLVTACWACNFGKMEYTVSELGISDPRERQPISDGWSGMLNPVPVGS